MDSTERLIEPPPRRSQLARLLLLPTLIVTTAAATSVCFVKTSDWRGLTDELARVFLPKRTTTAPTPRVEPKPPAPSPRPAEPGPLIAKAEPKAPPPVTAPKSTNATEPKAGPPKPEVWDEIQREAEKKQAELAEIDRLKEESAKKLAEAAPKVEQRDRMMAAARRAEVMRRFDQMIQAQQRAMAADLERMLRSDLGEQGRVIDEMMRGFFGGERLPGAGLGARPRPRFGFNPPPMPPMPGMPPELKRLLREPFDELGAEPRREQQGNAQRRPATRSRGRVVIRQMGPDGVIHERRFESGDGDDANSR